MNQTTAQTTATNTGKQATRLGLMLTNYTDPDVGQLIAECLRVGVPTSDIIR